MRTTRRIRDWVAASRRRVYALVLLAILTPMALFAVVATQILKRQMEENSYRDGRQVTLASAAAVNAVLASATDYLEGFATRRQLVAAMVKGDSREIERHLANAHELHQRFLFVSAYTPDGTMTAIFPQDKIVGRNYAFRDWYRGVTGGWKPYVSEVYRTEAASQPIVAAVAVPVVDAERRVVGILMAAYRVETLDTMVREGSSAGGWELTVLDQRSQRVSGGAGLGGAEMRKLKASSAGVELLEHPEGRVVAAYAPVRDLGWAVVAVRPAAVVFQPLHVLQQQLLLFGLVCVALGAGGAMLLSGLYGELDAAKRFFDLSAEPFCTADFEGRFTRLNPAWETMMGMGMETILATPFLELVHPEDREATMAEAQKLEEGGRTIHFQNRYRRADGTYCWLEWSATSSVPRRTIYAVAKDVTASKQIARMKDEFVATVSHELRTPLASLRGFAELMLERDFPAERRREFLEIIKRESNRLANLINDFLDLQRIEAGRQEIRLQARELAPVLRQTVELFASGERHHLVLQVPESLPRLWFDADRTAQVMSNLISNAVKYSPAGGEIAVGARVEGDEAVVWVRDEGLGIPAEQMEKLFTKFHRVETPAHREVGGTGLGLALVKQLVELQNGRVWVESAPGKGSTFYFTLRCARVEPVAAIPALPLLTEAPDILIVEDDAAFANLLRTHFEGLGLRVASTAHAEQALEWVRVTQPGVILLDIVLPGMSGWEFLLSIKSDEMLKSIPVIVVTVTEPNVRGLVLGGVEYLPKTLSPEQLASSVRACAGAVRDKRILVVDDDPLFRRALVELLRRERDWLVDEAGHGEEALRMMHRQMPDLLVLDLLMPGMDGFELLRRLREDRRAVDLQVLVVTGKDLTEQEVEYLQRRMASLVGKREIQLDYFTEVVERALGRELRSAAAAKPTA